MKPTVDAHPGSVIQCFTQDSKSNLHVTDHTSHTHSGFLFQC